VRTCAHAAHHGRYPGPWAVPPVWPWIAPRCGQTATGPVPWADPPGGRRRCPHGSLLPTTADAPTSRTP